MIDKTMIKPFEVKNDLVSNDLSVPELKVIKNSVSNDNSLSKELKDSLDFKLESMMASRTCKTIDAQSLNYIERHGSASTHNFKFFNNPVEDKIEICDLESGEYVFDHKCIPIQDIADQFDKEIRQAFMNHVVFCESCGRPVSKGFTNEEIVLCDNAEFAIHMDAIYGKGNWVSGPDGYYALDERDGKYKPTGWYVIDFE